MLWETAGGEGDTLIRFLCCGYFLTPPSCGHLPYILYCKTQGRIETQPFSLYCFVVPRNATGDGREEVNTLRCIVFVFLPLYFLTETPCNATGHGKGGGEFPLM